MQQHNYSRRLKPSGKKGMKLKKKGKRLIEVTWYQPSNAPYFITFFDLKIIVSLPVFLK
jgi:hypothetical protein